MVEFTLWDQFVYFVGAFVIFLAIFTAFLMLAVHLAERKKKR
jgi:hypothetical protein